MSGPDLTPEVVEELRRLAEKATPGPWRWEVRLNSKRVELCGGPPKSGFGAFDLTVVSFARWGMSGAAPVFWSWGGHSGSPQRADEVAVPVAGREHHAAWFRDLDHPNAAYIAAANPAVILALLARLSHLEEQARKDGEALEPFAEAADEYDPREDDTFEVWKDAGPLKVNGVGAAFKLGNLRAARARLSDREGK